MKKSILIFTVLSFILFSFNSTKNKVYKTNLENSVIHWKGFKPTGSHYGTIKLSNGYFSTEGNSITGGEFTIDMNSIVDLDMPQDNEYNAKLVNHLKSPDFFDVKKYPKATFKITNSEKKGDKTLIRGALTIKDKSNPIEFIATVKIEKQQLLLKSESFKIDRSKWDVRYKSKSFFDGLADKFIYDEMEISIDIEANN